jgi:hypothetical protein
MKIGLSLSFCVRDIAVGKIAIEEVAGIVCGTRCMHTPETWEEVMEGYAKTAWHKNPEYCVLIARRLRTANKLWEPRQEGCKGPHIGNIGCRVWTEDPLEVEDLINPDPLFGVKILG